MTIYDITQKIKRVFYRVTYSQIIKRGFARCGKQVSVPEYCSFAGIKNIYVGNDVSFGEHTQIMTTRAKVIIGDNVMFGPNVTIITGNHRTDIVGRTMISITDSEKRNEDDEDIVFEGDNWIGANVTILKGVTIGMGSIVAAGSVVVKNVPENTIIGGVPGKVIKKRMPDELWAKHIQEINGLIKYTIPKEHR